MDKYKIDCLVIGGGISGLAVARNLSSHFQDIFLIEKNQYLGQETSSRNSEVIHAGIYYKKNSLKAKLCLEGKELLYEYLERQKIDYKRCGKFIISTTDEETTELEKIMKKQRVISPFPVCNLQMCKYQTRLYFVVSFSKLIIAFDTRIPFVLRHVLIS